MAGKWKYKNFRVLYCEETQLLGIYEVFYDVLGNYSSHSEKPVNVSTDKPSPKDLLDCLEEMALAVEKPWYPINNVSVATLVT